MTIPDALLGMDYCFDGDPYIEAAGKASVDLLGMDYCFDGDPFVTCNWSGEAPPTTNYGLFAFFMGM